MFSLPGSPFHRRRLIQTALPMLAGVVVSVGALAQQTRPSEIYTCVDGKGRRITSDRPIVECLDREQRELDSTGLVRRVVPPSYTAEERAWMAEQRRAEDEQRARVAEERRRDRALMIRYPNQAMHDKARAEALAQIDEVVDAVNKREQALEQQRKDIRAELEFYQNDPNKAPLVLQRKIEDNAQQMQVQKRFQEEQAQEKKRINARFDEELTKLRQLWGGNAAASDAAVPRR